MVRDMWQAIADQLSETLMFSFNIVEKSPIHGGDINDCYMISDGEQRYFVKINQRDFYSNFEIEAESIHVFRQESVLIPEHILTGKCKEHAFLILNYLPMNLWMMLIIVTDLDSS